MSSTIKTSSGTQPVDPYKAKNYENPPLDQKVKDLVHFISEIKYGMLTTKASDGDHLTSRCMALAGKVCVYSDTYTYGLELTHENPNQENGGIDLIFHTNLFSGKTMDLTVHPQETNMSFLDPVSGSWASVSGSASILAEPEIVHKYYSPALKAWLGDLGDGVHDGGPNDPRIGVIRVEAKLATYVLAARGAIGRAVETAKGAIKGETPAINKIRELSVEELAQCKSSWMAATLCKFMKRGAFADILVTAGRMLHKGENEPQ